MPNYLRIVARTRNEALDKIEKNLGHKNITILREGNLVNKKRKWFRTIEEKAYYIECVEYRESRIPPSRESDNTTALPALSLKADFSPPSSKRIAESSPMPEAEPSSSSTNQLRDLVTAINQRESRGGGAERNEVPVSYSPSTTRTTSPQVSGEKQVDSEYKRVYHFLTARDFSPKFAKKICDYFDLNILNDTSSYHRLAEHVASFFKFTGIVKVKNDSPHYVFAVGPTGVGKTTTLSKIASSFYTDEEHYPKPALIKFASLDAKRIMAMEQLRKFANILRVPFKSIYTVDDFKELYRNSKKKELVLIDTSGVSKQDADLIDEIAVFTRSVKTSKEVHLCLSAQSRYLDLKKIYEILAKTKPDRILITKIDESYSLGSILSFIDEVALPISYITNGQDVPIDIISGDKGTIKKILLKEWGL